MAKKGPENPWQEEMNSFYNQPWNMGRQDPVVQPKDQKESQKKIAVILAAVLAVALLVCGALVIGATRPQTPDNTGNHQQLQGNTTKPANTENPCGASGHQWVGGNCVSSAVCANCGEEGYVPDTHNWIEASYEAPKTCCDCGITEGKSLGYCLTWCQVLGDTNYSPENKDITRGTWRDCFGNTYEESLRFWIAHFGNYYNTETITFQLNTSYREMVLTSAAEEHSDPDGCSRVMVFGDGELIYESDWMYNYVEAYEVTIDIEGYSTIEISCTTDSPVHCYCLVKAVLYN